MDPFEGNGASYTFLSRIKYRTFLAIFRNETTTVLTPPTAEGGDGCQNSRYFLPKYR